MNQEEVLRKLDFLYSELQECKEHVVVAMDRVEVWRDSLEV